VKKTKPQQQKQKRLDEVELPFAFPCGSIAAISLILCCRKLPTRAHESPSATTCRLHDRELVEKQDHYDPSAHRVHNLCKQDVGLATSNLEYQPNNA